MIAIFRLYISVVVILVLSGTSQAHDDIPMGAILPLTGEAAFWGYNSKRGLELALADVQSHPGGRRPRFIFEDDRCSAKDAIAAFHKLVHIDKVKIIFGPICSSAVAAVAPLAEKSRVLMLVFAESDEVKTGPYVRRLWVPNSLQGQRIAHYAYDNRLRSIAILTTQNAYGKTLSEAFAEHFVKLGGVIVAREEYAPSSTTFRSALVRLKAARPEALFFASYIKDGAILVREARNLGLSIPLLGSSTINNVEFLSSAGSAADGLVFADLADSSSATFKKRWEVAFSSPYPGIQSGAPLFYDIATVLSHYVRDHDAKDAGEYLRGVNYPGVSGAIQFTPAGNLDRHHELYRVQGGRVELLSSDRSLRSSR
jgi:branched-chain amino acid transport system substrate-binding protein